MHNNGGHDICHCAYLKQTIILQNYQRDISFVKNELKETPKIVFFSLHGVQLKDRKRAKDLMFTLGLNETINHLVMTNSIHWYGYVLRREDSHV